MVNRQQSDLDRLADLVIERLLRNRGLPGQDGPGREVFGPVGAPVPELPELPRIPDPEELPKLYPRARLAIDGIELTQSIQHFGTGYGADNSVPIVALKPLAVRAYAVVRPALFGPDPLSGQFVTGTLILSRWGKEVFRTGPTRAGGARLGTIELLRRELWDTELTYWLGGGGPGGAVAALTQFKRNCPLNFIVPAWYLRKGRMIATLALRTESGATATEDIDFDVIDVPAPRVALVRVNWTSSANVASSPTNEGMLGTLSLAERMMPFPYFDTRILTAELDETGNFWMPVAAGGCNTRWNDLLEDLTEMRFWVQLFQLADIVYGIVPAEANEAPAGSTVNSGCGDPDNGVAASFAGLGRTFAHELGHIYGRAHVAVAGDPENDPDYPRYGGDPRAIGEAGVDLGESPVAIYTPPRSNDIMAYWDATSPDDQKWISPYTYRALIDERFRHASVAASAARFVPFLVMRFRIYRLATGGNKFERHAVHRITAPGIVDAGRRSRPADRRDAVSIDFVDRHDRIVSTHWCRQAHTLGSCGCCGSGAKRGRQDDGWGSYVEAIEWPDGEATRLLVRKSGTVIAELAVGEPPSVSIASRRGDDDTIEVTVKASHGRETPSTVLLFTADDGRTWEPFSLRTPLDCPVKVPLSRLKGGSRCRFRAVATAELQAAEASTESFELPQRGRRLYLRLAAPRCATETAALSALVDAGGQGVCSPSEVHWRSDLDGDLGRGLNLLVALSEGTHEITASIPDGLGGVASAMGLVRVGAS